MRRILLVSCYFASDYGAMVWGPFIRLRMLLEAAALAAEKVDLLLFAAKDMITPGRAEAAAASIEHAWNLRVEIILACRAEPDHTLRGLYRGITDVRHHPDYGRAGGDLQAEAVRSALRADTDLIVAKSFEAGLAVARCAREGFPAIIDIDDIEHISYERRVRQLPFSVAKLLGLLRVSALERGVLETVRAYPMGFACSETDRRYISARGVATRLEVVPNAMAFSDSFDLPSSSERRAIIYLGSYAYQPNADAAEELINDIFPRVLARCPDAILIIAGAYADKLPSFGVRRRNTEIVGFVADVADVYRRAAVSCCPIRSGGGTRLKIIEASAWKIPTVSTVLGAEGLDFEDGREILLADDPSEMVNHCVALLEAPARAAAIGEAAYVRAIGAYDRAAIIEKTAAFYRAGAVRTT